MTTRLDEESRADQVQSASPGGWKVGSLMRATDWAKTALGDPSIWSPALRMMVNFLLANRFPQLLWWGPQFCSIYNEAYIPILGGKHPWALGRPVSEVWKEIWHVLKPLIETPFYGGPATWMEDILLEINRRGFFEETHFTIAYSPVPDETAPGGIGGVLATVHEITEQVISERRLHALRELGAHSAEPKSAEEACLNVGKTLSSYAKDIPFLLLYLLDEHQQTARLACCLGVDPSDRACPSCIQLNSHSEGIWPLAIAGATEELQLVGNLRAKFGVPPQGPWAEAPSEAAVVPIRSNMQHKLAGFIVAGLSSRIQFDQNYRDFLELMSTQIAAMIAYACAYEQERKRAEALAELDRAKTLFFSNISHELRTPLTLLLGPTESALSSKEGALKGADLEMVHRNELRLLKLVNTLLDFSRIEAGRVQAIYEPTNLCSLTADIASAFRSAMEKAGLRFDVCCEPIEEPVHVDRQMWEKIVLNLLSNAFKFTFEGQVQLTLKRTAESVELIVRDTGVGIPADQLARIFERFHRVENVRARTYEGTGIGLALVEELVKFHRGSVHVESALGAGSSFRVTIPTGTAHLPAERIQAVRSQSSTAVSADAYVEEAERSLQGLCPGSASGSSSLPTDKQAIDAHPLHERDVIVIADDNADMREYLTHLLREHYIVHAVPDGVEAIKAARRLRPALVLADIMMPGIDGFGVLTEIRSDESLRSTPVILLSARAGEESRLEGLHAGADDYLVKPFTARELIARVTTHVNMANLRRQAAERETRIREEADIALAASGTGTFRWNPQTDVVEIDGNLKRLLEFGPGETVETIEEFVRRAHPDDTTRLIFAIDACRAGADFEMEFRVSLPNRDLRWLYGRAKMQFEDGQPTSLVGACTDITTRKNAEESLRESELWLAGQKQAFQAAINGAPLSESLDVLIRTAIKQFRGEARCAFYIANTAGTELLHIAGMPEECARCVDGFKIGPQSLASGLAVHTGEPQITPDVREDPRWKPWLWLAEQCEYRGCWSFPVTTSTGKAVGTFAMYFKEPRQARSRDIQLANVLTHAAAIIISRSQEAEERARTERVLYENEQRLRLAQQAAEIGTFEWNLRTKENRWTPELEVIYGLAPGSFAGTQEDWERLVHPDDRQAAIRQVELAFETGSPVQAEWRTVWPDGSTHWILGRWQVFTDESGAPAYMAGINIDVTGRKTAEEAQRYLAAIVESSEDAIISKDLAGIVKSWNPQATRLFGYSPQEMIGQPIRKIIPPELQNDEELILATIARGEGIEHFETVRVAKDGKRIDVSLTVSPIRDENGQIVGASKIVRDITQRKQTEQALRITERLASVGRLAATVAHEINNPLEAITNLLYLARFADDPTEIHSLLAKADEELARVALLSKQTLGFYREKNGARALRIGSIVESLVFVFTPKARNRSVAIKSEIRQDPEIYAIEGEIRQLVANLLSNSIDAIVGGGTIRVRVAAGRAWDQASLTGVRLTIADSGRGIAPEHRPKLFEPFFTANKDVGTGLGLWISKGIVERHGGNIRFKTRIIPGRSGTLFTVFLPSDEAVSRLIDRRENG
jgi:PAS domain S-box-containing protein